MTRVRAAFGRFTLAAVAGFGGFTSVAAGGTFHPSASPEYVQTVTETLASQIPVDSERFTPGAFGSAPTLFPRRLYWSLEAGGYAGEILLDRGIIFQNPNFLLRDHYWSILPDGVLIESSPPTIFHPSEAIRDLGGQFRFIDRTEEDGGMPNGVRFNFTNRLRERLNDRPPPFGFFGDGGEARWIAQIREAFLRWQNVTSLRLVEVGDSGQNWDRSGFLIGNDAVNNAGQGDIRIAMTALDGPTLPDGSGGALLAYTYPTGALELTVDVFDDNRTPDNVEDDIMLVGYLGNIILDSEERWNDQSTPNLFFIVLMREIGTALGLYPACPGTPAEPFSLMQAQIFSTGSIVPGGGGEPFPQLFFDTPQEDDIRAIHYLYGDRLEPDDSLAEPKIINYAPNPQTNVFTFAPHLAQPNSFFSTVPLSPDGVARPVQMSLAQTTGRDSTVGGDAPDIDTFRFVLPDTVTTADLAVTIEPVGTNFSETLYNPLTNSCGTTVLDRIPVAYQNLSFEISAFDPYTNVFTPLISIDDGVAGEPETTEIPVSAGTYFISVSSDAPTPVDTVQLYNITVTITTPREETGVEFSRLEDLSNIEYAKDLGYFGSNSSIGVLDGAHIADSHIVFAGRSPLRISWPGVLPAVTTAGTHATTVAGIAAGSQFLNFEGVAPEAGLASATVSTQAFPDGTFTISKNALYYALFSLTSRTISVSAGLDGPVGVVLSAFGAGGRRVDGEDSVTQAFDTAAWMTGVPIVVAAGNSGLSDRGFTGCALNVPVEQTDPGQQYLGSRSIVNPATAFNVISVGSSGEVDPNTVTQIPADAEDFDQINLGVSSRGPIDALDLDAAGAAVSAGVRNGVDILAPGAGIVAVPPDFTPPGGGTILNPCLYDGPTATSFVFAPSIAPGEDPEAPAQPEYFDLTQGTSISAAMVAGAVALLQDISLDQDPPLQNHPTVLKAVLLNGARKMRGWTNSNLGPGKPQDNRDGFNLNLNPNQVIVQNTINPLDRAQGAGVMDLERTIENYFTGYPIATPPQAQFEGPWIDVNNITNSRVPTIRRPTPPNPNGVPNIVELNQVDAGGADGLGSADAVSVDEVAPIDDQESGVSLRSITAQDPEYLWGEPLQSRYTDQKLGRGPQGVPGPVGGPRTPFVPPATGGSNGPLPPEGPSNEPPGPPAGIPGNTNNGVRPREIDPIFVDPMGWDFANIDQVSQIVPPAAQAVNIGFIDYVINVPLLGPRPDPQNPAGAQLAPDRLTVTLCWQRELTLQELNFSNPENPKIGIIDAAEFDNLDLFLIACDSNGNPTGTAIRSSVSIFSPTEHIFTDIPQSSLYLIRVQWTGTVYDVLNKRAFAETQYGLAWRVDFSPRSGSLAATDMGDLMTTLAAFGTRPGDESYNLEADRDSNGKVNFSDLTNVLSNWNPPARIR